MKIEQLFIYPVKSCAGIAVAEARVTARGLEHDRRWMVTDEAGRFLTQRTLPEMALVQVAVDGAHLLVRREGHPPLALPLLHDDGARLEVEVWGDRLRAVRHDHGSEWFSRVLGAAVQLVCMPGDARRPVDPEFARAGDIVSFADGYPLLLVNRASLVALGDAGGGGDSGAAVDVRRFRPNVVVSGAAAWAEDQWRALAVAASDGTTLTLRTPKPCARCAIPAVDPDRATITKEPLRALARLRSRDRQVWFGVNAIPDGEGTLRVGDALRLLS